MERRSSPEVSRSGENLSALTRSPISFCPTWAAFFRRVCVLLQGRSVSGLCLLPDGKLRRANRDGSGRVRLTDPPIYPKVPGWSPDGTQILFTDSLPNCSYQTYVVSSGGGSPQRISPG